MTTTAHEALATAASTGLAGTTPHDPAGHDARMRQLREAHAKHVYRFLLRLTCGDRPAAKDLLQQTLLVAGQEIGGHDADVATLRPWLLALARRIASDSARVRHARPTEIGTLDLSTVPAERDDEVSRQVIRAAMVGLSPEHREVIVEIYFRGRSCVDTAALLGIPESTVTSRALLGLRALRAAIDSARTNASAGTSAAG